MIGTTIGRFRIVRLLGRGAMGEVYLAEDDRIGQRAAIKRLLNAAEPGNREQVLREARNAARLDHPNIARIIDVIEADGAAHLVMEYLEGENLAERTRRGPLLPAEVASIAVQLGDALTAAHAARVVHRDLKPANIQIDATGRIKVLDFGLARIRPMPYPGSSGSTNSASGDPLSENPVTGTLPYIPPECFAGKPADFRSDLYSAGVTLFELATGKRPFEGPDVVSLIHAVTSHPTPEAKALNPEVPDALSRKIQRAMARDPADRYQSAAEFRDDFRGVTQSARFPAIRVFLIVAIVTLLIFLGRHFECGPVIPITPSSLAPTVLAVLPVRFTGPDSAYSYMAAGMNDYLVAGLAALPITVISLPRGRVTNNKIPGDSLGATWVLDTAILEAGGPLQVTIKLLDRDGETVRWSTSLQGQRDRVLDLHRRSLNSTIKGLEATKAFTRQSTKDKVGEPIPSPTDNAEAWAEFSQAKSFMENLDNPENVDNAITLLQSALRRDPEFAMAHAELGRAYLAHHARTKNLDWLTKAHEEVILAQKSGSGIATVQLALARVEEDRAYPAIAESLALAVARDYPYNAEAFNRAASAGLEIGHVEEALDWLDQAISLRPAYWVYYYNRARVLARLERHPEALASVGRATELQPDSPLSWSLLGVLRQQDGDTAGAKVAYLKSLRLNPRPITHNNLGKLEYDQGRYEQALAYFRAAIELAPDDPQLRLNAGDALMELAESESARAEYRAAIGCCGRALNQKPNHAVSLTIRAVCNAKLGRTEDAMTDMSHALSYDPTNPEMLFHRAEILAIAGQLSEALAALRTAIEYGYSREEARKDKDLMVLRNQTGFTELLENR